MDRNEVMRRMNNAAAVATVLVMLMVFIRRYQHRPLKRRNIPRHPSYVRDLDKHSHMRRILNGSTSSCQDYLRMRIGPFMNLAQMMRDGGLLKDTIHVPIEEQLATFLYKMGHKSKNRARRIDFIRSGETISRYFNKVLGAIFSLRDRFMKQAPNETSAEIMESSQWFPFFKDCIGLIDGTHIDATVPTKDAPKFRGRKGITQNVLAAVTPNKRFTYVMAGWEGAANDFTILKDALSLPPPNGLRVYEGKYYLCDVGYPTMPGFIAPYRGVRYHLKEHSGRVPNNRRELFNLRHSTLRSKIECTFGILKSRFKILSAKPHHPFPSQVNIVIACTILHNYIAIIDPNDKFLNEFMHVNEEDGDILNEDAPIIDFTQQMTQREQLDTREEWKSRRDQIA
ncbi:uncharacterized protein LOC109839604 [Asparagus officinalis]|uniref:uncharacterized protein LOC109839604 n=1 Tax=Asparagus officinalis TaxID=4686 RepID=UPI00098E23D2|nr:uncharacterized protein LOC109839604 [Asparagus officinalis]